MKTDLPFKLGIAVVVLFAFVIGAMVLYPIIYVRYYSSKLESSDPDERWAAFQCLGKYGRKGREGIINFCRRASSIDWNEIRGNVKLRTRPENFMYSIEKLNLLHPDHPRIVFNIKNFDDHDSRFYCSIASVAIEPLIENQPPSGYEYSYSVYTISKAELKKEEAISELLPCYIGTRRAGIYKIRVNLEFEFLKLEQFRPESGEELNIATPCFYIAVLPKGK
ncbi:MAG: hypothetical protein ACYS8W_17415 [Planctomycetota bacterium]|jgi:hypothetical protein